jgi:hypothetical protein
VVPPSFTIPTAHPTTYVPRGANTLRLIFQDHSPAFAKSYDSLYAQDYGKFRLERISHVAERFESCGDYTKGIARIQCSNPSCRFEYFRPFSCKSFYLCPSCSQKRTLLFVEYLDEQLLLNLPHRQFVFSIPKALRIFFRHDQRLFGAVSSLLFSLIRQFYRLAAGSPRLVTAAVIAFQPFGDFLRANAHWHAIVLEGGFSHEGRFLFLPIHDTQKFTEAFRRAVMKLLLSKALITEEFAATLLCWKNSGFSDDNKVRINGDDHKTRVALAQYIARAPLSLDKLSYLPSQGTVRYSSDFNPAIGDTIKVWNAHDFIAAATLFIPPQGVRVIKYFGLYASRSRWRWPQWDHIIRHAPQGWKEAHGVADTDSSPQPSSATVPESACRSAWARLIAKVYEIDPLVCPHCSSKMRILAVITDPAEVKKILRHLIKIDRPPPGLDLATLN